MTEQSRPEDLATTMHRINQTWLTGRVDDLAPMLHPEIVMLIPGFSGRMQGREPFLAGFRDFCENARIHEFTEQDFQVDVIANIGVATYRFEMVYERAGARYRSTGRDLWVFHNESTKWIAVWRTMLDMQESAA